MPDASPVIRAIASRPRSSATPWLYYRISLSFREVEDLLAQRGIAISYETIRHWCDTFGLAYAQRLRHRPEPPRPTGDGSMTSQWLRGLRKGSLLPLSDGGELRLKLGLTLSPRTIRRYMPSWPRSRGGRSAQSWATFLHNHAGAVLACDFFIVVTATFQRLYVFVILDIRTRRVVHWKLTDHPTAEWTIQQFRNGLPPEGVYRFLVHDRDGIFAPADEALRSMSLQVLKTPVHAPQANAHCERFVGTVRRECLAWMIPLGERHVQSALAEWISHYNSERHIRVGSWTSRRPSPPNGTDRTSPATHRVVASARHGGLHRHYQLELIAA